MRFDDPLDDIFQNRSHVRVLRALVALPEGIDASTREIARRAGVSHPTASTVLENLGRQGLVNVRRRVWADEYELNHEHEVVRRLESLFGWERRLLDALVRFLAREI